MSKVDTFVGTAGKGGPGGAGFEEAGKGMDGVNDPQRLFQPL